MTTPASTDKAALDQLYLKTYATVSLFFIQNLDAGEEREARQGRWPSDGNNLDTRLISLHLQDTRARWWENNLPLLVTR